MQQGESHYREPRPHAAEAGPPTDPQPPPRPPPSSHPLNFDELSTTVSGTFQEDEATMDRADRTDQTAIPANRWPRHETLALIKIRSEMDSAFKESTLKGPLWEEISRKLAEQGITRSAKKCKEKFDNIHKYHKRTTAGRAGRHHDKNYRFSSELEALRSTTVIVPSNTFQPTPISSIPPVSGSAFSSVLDPESESNLDEEEEEGRKRKRWRTDTCGRKTMAVFGEMMKRVLERQEAMQRRFLDVIEKREADRIAREEAWKQQQAARLLQEHEIASRERAMATSRNAAIVTLLGSISHHTVPIPSRVPGTVINDDGGRSRQTAPECLTVQAHREQQHGTPRPPRPPSPGGGDPASPRWPKAEVLALIDLRRSLDVWYRDNGAKGPFWEEVSAGMRRIGYNRNAKRCKEKWENINKYFRKVKEGSRTRPEDAKTCPYFHQLDAIYRSKSVANGHNRNGQSNIPVGIVVREKKEPTVGPLDCAVDDNPPDIRDSVGIRGCGDDDNDDDDEDREEERMARKNVFQKPKPTPSGVAAPPGTVY